MPQNMAPQPIQYPASSTPLIAGGPKIFGPDAADNATTAQVKAAATAGSNTYVFAESINIPLPQANGNTTMLQIIQGWPIVLDAHQQAQLTAMGISLPTPS